MGHVVPGAHVENVGGFPVTVKRICIEHLGIGKPAAPIVFVSLLKVVILKENYFIEDVAVMEEMTSTQVST